MLADAGLGADGSQAAGRETADLSGCDPAASGSRGLADGLAEEPADLSERGPAAGGSCGLADVAHPLAAATRPGAIPRGPTPCCAHHHRLGAIPHGLSLHPATGKHAATPPHLAHHRGCASSTGKPAAPAHRAATLCTEFAAPQPHCLSRT